MHVSTSQLRHLQKQTIRVGERALVQMQMSMLMLMLTMLLMSMEVQRKWQGKRMQRRRRRVMGTRRHGVKWAVRVGRRGRARGGRRMGRRVRLVSFDVPLYGVMEGGLRHCV